MILIGETMRIPDCLIAIKMPFIRCLKSSKLSSNEEWRSLLTEKKCKHHGQEVPCSCAMGKLYRFIEPLVLQQLKQRKAAHGYELLEGLQTHTLTDAAIDKAALYRTLRQLEACGYLKSEWEDGASGPAKRVYKITRSGERHLKQWAVVIGQLSKAMSDFVREIHAIYPESL